MEREGGGGAAEREREKESLTRNEVEVEEGKEEVAGSVSPDYNPGDDRSRGRQQRGGRRGEGSRGNRTRVASGSRREDGVVRRRRGEFEKRALQRDGAVTGGRGGGGLAACGLTTRQ